MDAAMKLLRGSRVRRRACIPFRGADVTLLSHPPAFFEGLKTGIQTATSRISLASLYLGNGPKERELVSLLADACRRNRNLRVRIILDHSRALRGVNTTCASRASSVSILAQLCADFPDQVHLGLFRMPQLEGWIGSRLSSPWNESVATQHMKAYVFDDTLIMSGANLSHDYFTNRQDRAMKFVRSSHLANFYHDIIEDIGGTSFAVKKPDQASRNAADKGAPAATSAAAAGVLLPQFPGTDSQLCITPPALHLRKAVSTSSFWMKHLDRCRQFDSEGAASLDGQMRGDGDGYDSWGFPTFQFPPAQVNDDEELTVDVLSSVKGGKLHVATGYMNFTDRYANALIDVAAKMDEIKIITASMPANGFMTARGIAGAIPMAYLCFVKNFWNKCEQSKHGSKIRTFEWEKKGHTFHAKGLWWYGEDEDCPSITTIGSPNFGMRSAHRDLESQLFIATDNPSLRSALRDESKSIFGEPAASGIRLDPQHNGSKLRVVHFDSELWKQPDKSLSGFGFKRGLWIPYVAATIKKFM